MRKFKVAFAAVALLSMMGAAHSAALECTGWQTAHPEWIWCDDFESNSALETNYFDVNRSAGMSVATDQPYGGTGALKMTYQAGVEEAGNVKLGFGRSAMPSKLQTTRDFNEIYWRFYTKTSSNWVGNARKVTRATVFTSSNWTQAAIGHLWEDTPSGLSVGVEPASGVSGSTVLTTQYNDLAHFSWLGKQNATTPIYSTDNRNRWFCIELHMKLNTPGASDGLLSVSIDGKQEAQATNLNFRGSYTGYGINSVMLEAYANGGFSQTQSRWYDNFIVSTAPIGCGTPPVRPNPPTNVKAG